MVLIYFQKDFEMFKDLLKKLLRKELYEAYRAGYFKRNQEGIKETLESREFVIRNVFLGNPVFALLPHNENPIIGICTGVKYVRDLGELSSPVAVVKDYITGTDRTVGTGLKICTPQKLNALLNIEPEDRWVLLDDPMSCEMFDRSLFYNQTPLSKEEIMQILTTKGFLEELKKQNPTYNVGIKL